VPLVRNRRPSKGCLEVVLRATQGVRNNIPYITIVKTLYNNTVFYAVCIVIPKVSLYLDFIRKTYQTSKLYNNIAYGPEVKIEQLALLKNNLIIIYLVF